MLFWSGRGIYSVIILVASFMLLSSILPDQYIDAMFFTAFFIAAIFSWIMGNKWFNESSQINNDTASKEEVIPPDSLFWIPTKYWGIIFGVFGLIMFIQQFL